MRYPRDKAIDQLEGKGLKESRKCHHGTMYRHTTNGKRVIVPDDPTVNERNFRQILHDGGVSTLMCRRSSMI